MRIPVIVCAAALLSTSATGASVAQAKFEANLGVSQKFTGFRASRDQADGIYQVFLRDDGTHSEHIKLADIADDSAPAQRPTLAARGIKAARDAREVKPHGGYDQTQAVLSSSPGGRSALKPRQAESVHAGVTCSYWGALLGSTNIAASTKWLADNCTQGGEGFVNARSSIYAKSNDVVAYVCNYAPNAQHCTKGEVQEAVYGIHTHWKSQDGIVDVCHGKAGYYYHFYWWKSYGIDDIANGFCDFGPGNQNGFQRNSKDKMVD